VKPYSGALRLNFDRRVMLRFHGSAITSDCGLLAYRELDDVLALTTSGGERLAEWLTRPANLAALAALPGQWIDAVHQRRPPRTIVLDMDSNESPTYGEQEGSAYNGHFGCTCYHPLFVFNQLGDLERSALRPGCSRHEGYPPSSVIAFSQSVEAR